MSNSPLELQKREDRGGRKSNERMKWGSDILQLNRNIRKWGSDRH
jgi:hypothetical protein